jgi:cytochrome c oxidase subunit II
LIALVDTRHEYQHLFWIYVPIAIGVVAVVWLAAMFALFRYRRRSPDQAAQWQENNRLEGGYAVLLGLVVAFLLYLTFTAEHRVDTVSAQERPVLVVNVTGAKWEWTFNYPRYGITQRSGTVGRQPLVVPIDVPVRFNLTSVDVIHAFFVPEVRFKRSLFPDNTQTVTLTFPDAGTFQGQCAEFCGLRHADMTFVVRAVSAAAFARWATSGGRTPV